jgi:hypothetical protein
MDPSAPQVFSPVTPAQFARLMAKAQAAGFGLTGNSGTASEFGVEVAWNYQPDKQELALQCLATPLFVSSESVNAKLKSLVTETLAEA